MPNNWKTYKLGEVAELSTGFAFKSKLYDDKGELKVIRGKNVTEGYLRWGGDARFWNHSTEKYEKHLISVNDIVVGMDGSKVGKNRALVRKKDLPAILAQRVARVVAMENRADQAYIWQLINNSPFENYVENIKTGTSIPHISLGQIHNFEILLPPLPEQKAIASILTALDDKIELNLQMNKTLEEMAMALYKQWFVDFEFPRSDKEKESPLGRLSSGAEIVSTSQTNSKGYKSSGGKFIDSELGPIPEGWEVKSMKDVLSFIVDNRGKTAPISDSGTPLIATNCVKNNWVFPLYDTVRFIDQPTYESWFRAHPIPGDIIFVNKGLPGSVNLVPDPIDFCIAQDMVALRVNDEVLTNHYLFCYLRSSRAQNNIRNRSVGTTIPHLKKTDLLKFQVQAPLLSQAKEFSRIVEPIFRQVNCNMSEIKTLTKLRDTLLPKLISGEVRVKEAEKTIATHL